MVGPPFAHPAPSQSQPSGPGWSPLVPSSSDSLRTAAEDASRLPCLEHKRHASVSVLPHLFRYAGFGSTSYTAWGRNRMQRGSAFQSSAQIAFLSTTMSHLTQAAPCLAFPGLYWQRLSFPRCNPYLPISPRVALTMLTAAGIKDLLVLHSGRLYLCPDGCSMNGQHCSALWLCVLQPTINSHGPVMHVAHTPLACLKMLLPSQTGREKKRLVSFECDRQRFT